MSKTVLYEMPDISYYNGNVNIKAVRDAGCPRIGLRVGYGQNNIDQKFRDNATACYNLSVHVLLYWFSYALNEDMAAQEAVYAIEQARKYWSCCPVAFDFEYDSVNYLRKNGIEDTRQTVTKLACAFLAKVRELGYQPVLYANEDYLNRYFDMDAITQAAGKVSVWYARYGLKNLPAARADTVDIWQYTSNGRVAGVSGRVDRNKVFTKLDDCVWNEESAPAVMPNLNIRHFQEAANKDGYRDRRGRKLAEDGIDGANTRYVRRKIALSAAASGSGYKTGSTGEVVRWLQGRLKELGFSLAADGRYGEKTREAVLKFQKNYNLTADGIAGYNTIQMLFYV